MRAAGETYSQCQNSGEPAEWENGTCLPCSDSDRDEDLLLAEAEWFDEAEWLDEDK